MMDAEDRRLFEQALSDVIADHSGAALDKALDEIGWRDALAEDARTAVSILFELQGRANTSSLALDQVLTYALGLDAATSGVVLPRLGRTDLPGQLEGSRLTCHGLITHSALDGELVVLAPDGEDSLAAILPVSELTLRPIIGMDPASGLVEVTADIPIHTAKIVPVSGAWPSALGTGQLAVAHQLIGASRAMLEMARTHALERVQFGVPISSFQAIRHRLAESLVAIEGATAATAVAWDDPAPLAPSYAKAIAGQGARTVAKHAQQVLAGMGFTAEHAFHHYLRRVLILDQVLGSGRILTREIGAELMSSREVPAVLPL
jgi:Acyl-CoA dehydrogenase, C-terminal domain